MIFRYACKTNQLNGVPCKLILSIKGRHQGETYLEFDKIFVTEKTWPNLWCWWYYIIACALCKCQMLSQRTSLRCLEGTFGWFQECWECLSEAGRILGTGLPSRDCLPPFLSPLIDRGLGAREWTCCGHSLKWRATHRWRVAASTHL